MRIPLLTFSAWLFVFFICTSIGLWIQQWFIKRVLNWETFLEAFWIGWAVCIVMLQFWHFVLPVTKLTLLAFGVIAAICGFMIRTRLGDFFKTIFFSWRKVALIGLPLLVMTFWLITRTMFSASVNDHAIYYLQTEKWFSTYPIVPGLGNLHGRLAFDSSYLLFTSLFQTWFGLPRAFHVGNGLLMLVLLFQLINGIQGVYREGGRAGWWQWFSLLSIVPLLQQLIPNWRIGWTTDFPTFVLGIVMTIHVLKLFQSDEKSSPDTFYRLIVLTLLVVVGVTVKLSFVVWCAGLMVTLLIIYRRSLLGLVDSRRRIALIITIGIVVLVPWVGRNIILSGYLAYPVAATALPVSWRIPVSSAVAEAQAIYGWARSPGKDFLTTLNNWDWFGDWFRGFIAQTFEVILPLGLTVFALIRIVSFRSVIPQSVKRLWIIPLIASLSLVYWFLTAPDVRFAGSMFWLLANGLVLIPLITLPEQRRVIPLCVVVLVSVVFALSDVGVLIERGATEAPMDTPALQEIALGSDTIVAPVTGDRCGNAPIPCAPGIPNARLRLRTPGKLADGFWIAPP